MKRLIKPFAWILLLAMALSVFASCSKGFGSGSASSSTVMQLKSRDSKESFSLSDKDFAFMMAYFKSYFQYYYEYYLPYISGTLSTGTVVKLDDLYDQVGSDGKTLAQVMTDYIVESSKVMLIVEMLCKEAGLTIDDSESLEDLSKVMQSLEDKYGGYDAFAIELAKLGFGRKSIERFERHSLLMDLLREYRYGSNGIVRIPEDEVRKLFDEMYLKVESYQYSYLTVNALGGTEKYVYDFGAEYSKEEVEAYFADEFLKVSYLQFKSQTDAENALRKLKDGSETFEDFPTSSLLSSKKSDLFVTKNDMAESLFVLLSGASENEWIISEEENGYYYVLIKKSFELSDMDETVEKQVRTAMVDREARVYYNENYVTVRHILYKEKVSAEQAYNEITADPEKFASHEEDTIDSGVQYSFTYGDMVEPFEKASFELEVDGVTLVESEYGWHIVKRVALEENDYKYDSVVSAMSKKYMKEVAEKHYEEMSSGEVTFTEPEDGALFTYNKASLLQISKQRENLRNAFQEAEVGEVVIFEDSTYGVLIFRKLAPSDDDFASVYATVESSLIDTAFTEYLRSFFDSVTINQDVLDRFDIRTVEPFTY